MPEKALKTLVYNETVCHRHVAKVSSMIDWMMLNFGLKL